MGSKDGRRKKGRARERKIERKRGRKGERQHAHVYVWSARERSRARECGAHRVYVRYRGIRQFAIYCLDFNLPSEWPWALPPLPTDIRRRKLPIVSMELDSHCAAAFMPQQRASASARARERACGAVRCVRACMHECMYCDTTRVRSFGRTPRTLCLSQKRLSQSVGISTITYISTAGPNV